LDLITLAEMGRHRGGDHKILCNNAAPQESRKAKMLEWPWLLGFSGFDSYGSLSDAAPLNQGMVGPGPRPEDLTRGLLRSA